MGDKKLVDKKLIEETESKLEELVKKPEYSGFHNDYEFNESIIEEAILFIGINPSNSREGDLKPINRNEKNIDTYSLEQDGGNHPYFKKFQKISEHSNIQWTHIDLLFFKQTSQKAGEGLLREKHGVGYIWKQLQLSKKLIEAANPRCIVVANAFARRLLGYEKYKDQNGKFHNEWMNFTVDFEPTIGTHMWRRNDGTSIPVFFSGMLTGQRALDVGSYERLKWHIDVVCNNKIQIKS